MREPANFTISDVPENPGVQSPLQLHAPRTGGKQLEVVHIDLLELDCAGAQMQAQWIATDALNDAFARLRSLDTECLQYRVRAFPVEVDQVNGSDVVESVDVASPGDDDLSVRELGQDPVDAVDQHLRHGRASNLRLLECVEHEQQCRLHRQLADQSIQFSDEVIRGRSFSQPQIECHPRIAGGCGFELMEQVRAFSAGIQQAKPAGDQFDQPRRMLGFDFGMVEVEVDPRRLQQPL